MSVINYDALPESARQRLLAMFYKMTIELFEDPAIWVEYEEWLAKRKEAKKEKEK